MKIRDIVPVALGKVPADVVVKNARILNVFTGELEQGNIALFRKRIAGIGDYHEAESTIDVDGAVVVPGLIDAHVHIESAMVSPREFAKAVLPWGTTTIIADPHEITNVLGLDGLEYMITTTEGIPLNVYIALPSAVPATYLETSGARVGPEDMVSFVDKYPTRIIALGEVMNFPGVLNCDNELITKIEILRHKYKKIDGHSPGLTGKELNAYIDGFIRSDHECTTAEEAFEKVSRGMQVLIREGTATRNLEAIVKVVNAANQMCFSFCTDDKEPQDIVQEGHINFMIKKAVRLGLDPVTAVRLATINTARHYNLRSMGAIAPGYKADMVVVDSLGTFDIRMVIKDSVVVSQNGRLTTPLTGVHNRESTSLGTVNVPEYTLRTFAFPPAQGDVNVIGVRDGDLYTDALRMKPKVENGESVADPDRDLCKVVVLDRHRGKGISRAFAHGFGIMRGAIATTIGHDSHNLAVAGVDDHDMHRAVDEVVKLNGGIVVVVGGEVAARVPLAIAGLMSGGDLESVIAELADLKEAIRKTGSQNDILMILHFIQLAVIPELKITDRGLVDVLKQEFVEMSES